MKVKNIVAVAANRTEDTQILTEDTRILIDSRRQQNPTDSDILRYLL